jgi:hypothetical protein
LIHFSEWHGTLLKSDRQLLGSFQKSFVKIWEMYQPIFKREEVHAFPFFKRVLQIKNHSCSVANKFNTTSKGELKTNNE